MPRTRHRMRLYRDHAIPLVLCLMTCTLSACGPSGRDLSDAQWLELQQDLQDERTEVGHQRDMLETDRREWDERERSEPVLAAVISSSVLLICCLLPLVLIGVLMWPRRSDTSSDVVCEVLLDDAIAQIVNSTAHDSHRIADTQAPRRLISDET